MIFSYYIVKNLINKSAQSTHNYVFIIPSFQQFLNVTNYATLKKILKEANG